MSIISCALMAGQEGSINQKWEPEYRVVFKVISSSIYDGPSAIAQGLSGIYGIAIGKKYNLATFGQPFETDASALCKNISITMEAQGENPVWIATCEFSTWDPFVTENPLNAPVLPVIEPVAKPRYTNKDKDGYPILNTAGEPYDSLEIDAHNFVFRFSRNYASLPAIVQYQGYINSATWQGFDPYTVKFNSARCEQIPSAFLQSTYWKVDYEFEYNQETGPESGDDDASDSTNTDGSDETPATTGDPIGWLAVPLNAGLYQLKSGTLIPCLIQGQVTSTPVPLDTNGLQIALPTKSNVIYNTFHVRPEADFNSIFPDFPTDLFAVQAYPSS